MHAIQKHQWYKANIRYHGNMILQQEKLIVQRKNMSEILLILAIFFSSKRFDFKMMQCHAAVIDWIDIILNVVVAVVVVIVPCSFSKHFICQRRMGRKWSIRDLDSTIGFSYLYHIIVMQLKLKLNVYSSTRHRFCFHFTSFDLPHLIYVLIHIFSYWYHLNVYIFL